jgi:hypothetical protein
MTKIQNSKPVLVIEYWNLRFVCNLVLGVCDFISSPNFTTPLLYFFCLLLACPELVAGLPPPSC